MAEYEPLWASDSKIPIPSDDLRLCVHEIGRTNRIIWRLAKELLDLRDKNEATVRWVKSDIQNIEQTLTNLRGHV